MLFVLRWEQRQTQIPALRWGNDEAKGAKDPQRTMENGHLRTDNQTRPTKDESMRKHALEITLVLFCLLAMAGQMVHVARVTSATWDEPHHLFDGYTVWKLHDYRINPEVPPLVKLTAALPLLGMELKVPPNQGRAVQTEAFNDGREFVFGNGGDRVLFPARMAAMGFTLLLAMLLFFAARHVFGAAAALFALALFVVDPNILANGALVTTDIGMSLMMLATTYAWYRYTQAERARWGWLGCTAVLAGLAVVTKFTGLLLLPMLVLLAVLEAARRRSWRVLGQRAMAIVAVSVVAWVILWGFFGFRYQAAANGQEINPALSAYLPTMPKAADARRLEFAAAHRLLPEAYLWGLANTKITEDVDNSYFFGYVYRHGTWTYFPAAFVIKSTLPLLVLLCLVPLAWRREAWGRRPEFAWLLAPVAVYLAVAISSKMNIGHRHLLPIYAFLYILAAGAAARLFARNRRWGVLLGVLLVWQVATSVRVAPGYMAYANEAWGGPDNVHRYLSDANSDWAQQLKETKIYLDQHHITNCWIAYFADGAIRPEDYDIHCRRLPTTGNLWWMNLPMNVPPVISGTVLISDSDLEGIEFGQGALNPYDSFRGVKPTAVIEHGLYMYDGTFSVPLASALWHANNAEWGISDPATALQEAQAAVALGPQSVYAQSALGDVLMKLGRKPEALAHYRAALSSARTIEPELQADGVKGLVAKIAAASAP